MLMLLQAHWQHTLTINNSSLGHRFIVLLGNNEALVGLYFEGQRYFPDISTVPLVESTHPLVASVVTYLNGYFLRKNKEPDFPMMPSGSLFQQQTWQALRKVPYGQTVSYQDLAKMLGKASSVRAVASAIARNPMSIVIPCHRVIGKNGELRGYAAGLDVKQALLDLEGECS